MKITAVETVRLGEHPNILFVRLHTDTGLVGLGDTWRLTETVNTFVHKVAAPLPARPGPRAPSSATGATLYRSCATPACAAARCAGSPRSTSPSGTSSVRPRASRSTA